MKTCLMLAVVAAGLFSFADDAPHWIGYDTTLRDAQQWVAPVETAYACSLDTFIADRRYTEGVSIFGTPLLGFLLMFK